LTRSVQDPSAFQCQAFQPLLSLVEKSGNQAADSYENSTQGFSVFCERFLNSEKVKYEKALAIQRLQREPDAILIELKYHLAWNVAHRRPIFSSTHQIFESVYDIFLRCSDTVCGFVNLLWLASDHVHLYVESFGDYSVEEIVRRIKKQSYLAILTTMSEIEKGSGENDLWDDAYFAQTIG
jgi:REP element-mobilizing transposase RayT